MTGHYAADGLISRYPIEGGIEITAEEYRSALDAMMDGRAVAIVEGALVLLDPPGPEPEPEPGPPDGQSVNAERDRRIRAGKVFSVSGHGDIAVPGDDRTQLNLLALKDTARDLKAANVTAPVIPFRDATDTEHALTADQVIQMVDAGKQYVQALYSASWAIKALDPIPTDYDDDARWPA